MKTYITKTALPGGINKGTKIIADMVGKKQVYVYEDGRPCPYDCAKEKSFFDEVQPPKYTVGSKIIVNTPCNVNHCSSEGVKMPSDFDLPAYTEFEVIGEKKINTYTYVIVKWNRYFYLVPERHIRPFEVYYYVSSSGGIFPAFVGRHPEADQFRNLTGNYHATVDEAKDYKQRVLLQPSIKSIKIKNSKKH